MCTVLNATNYFNLADIELKEAQRFFAQKFSCGASVTAEDEIIIQGDFTDDIIDVIQEKWPEVRCLDFYGPETKHNLKGLVVMSATSSLALKLN